MDKKSVDGEAAVRLCNYVDVYKNEYITAEMEFMAATATDDQIAHFSVRAGDVIITKDSETWDDIAVPAYVPQPIENLVCGYHLALVRADGSQLDGEYLSRCFAAKGINDQFQVAANGITRYGLDTQSIRCALFPLPPLEEQRAITRFLKRETARIDALIEKKERLIALLEEKRQAAVGHAVMRGPNGKDSALAALHQEVKADGCRFRLAYFRPETAFNPETQRLYQADAFTVIRQLRYSERTGHSLDLVLFLNGLPLFTAELKNLLNGQNVRDAIAQYRRTRNPREPLFTPGRCLAHFAVDPDIVYLGSAQQ